MAISEEGHVPQPEEKKRKLPIWALILVIALVLLLVVVCCLVILVVLFSALAPASPDWFPSFLFILGAGTIA